MKADLQVQQDVLAELKWDPAVDASHIGVEVKDGIVTLTGHVASYSEKWDAEQVAQRVAGVRALAIEIDVSLPGPSQRNDEDIARTVENVLQWMTRVQHKHLKVMVEGGWITLSGDVEWAYQRRAASDAVCHLMGVTGVSNQIVIKPGEELRPVKADIEAALRRLSTAGRQEISVGVLGDQVTLTGTVHSWLDRKLARYSVWGTPGVGNVIDHLAVVE